MELVAGPRRPALDRTTGDDCRGVPACGEGGVVLAGQQRHVPGRERRRGTTVTKSTVLAASQHDDRTCGQLEPGELLTDVRDVSRELAERDAALAGDQRGGGVAGGRPVAVRATALARGPLGSRPSSRPRSRPEL